MGKVEIVFATPKKQILIAIDLIESDTVQQVINRSGILSQCPDIDLATMPVGVFGKVCKLEQPIEVGDRVEIYRPLLQSPMDARRSRALK